MFFKAKLTPYNIAKSLSLNANSSRNPKFFNLGTPMFNLITSTFFPSVRRATRHQPHRLGFRHDLPFSKVRRCGSDQEVRHSTKTHAILTFNFRNSQRHVKSNYINIRMNRSKHDSRTYCWNKVCMVCIPQRLSRLCTLSITLIIPLPSWGRGTAYSWALPDSFAWNTLR